MVRLALSSLSGRRAGHHPDVRSSKNVSQPCWSGNLTLRFDPEFGRFPVVSPNDPQAFNEAFIVLVQTDAQRYGTKSALHRTREVLAEKKI